MHSRSPRWRRKAAAATAVAALSLSLLTACGNDGSSSAGNKLDVWVWQDASDKVQQATVDDFNKTSDVKAKLTAVPGEGYQNKVRTSMGSENAPDVFFNWGGGSVQEYVDKGLLLDLTPYLNKDSEFKNAFLPSVLDAGKVGDKYYGVPMRGTQPVMLFYNKKLFDDAKVKPPTNWNDLLKAVDTFKKKHITPFALAGRDAWTELMWLEYLLDRNGGPEVFAKIQNGAWQSKVDSSGWGDPAVLKTAQQVKELVDAGAFGTKFSSVSYNEGAASTLLAQGKAAMHLMGSWEYANQLANAPDFAKTGLGYAPFPTVPNGKGNAADIVGNPNNFWSVSAKTKNKDAVIEFIKMAGEESYAKSLIANGDVPTTTNAKSLLSKHSNPAYANFQYGLVESAPAFTTSWDQALPQKVVTPMLTEIQKLFNGQSSPQQFVDKLKALK